MAARPGALSLPILLLLTGLASAQPGTGVAPTRVVDNESAALADIRTVLSAESTFSSVSGGSYGDLGCLATPRACLDGYAGPAFLVAPLASERSGYRRVFRGGRAASRPRTFESFAYTATPVTVGQTGARSFCGDSSGLICFDPSGAELLPVGGACPSGCRPLDGSAPRPARKPAATPPPPVRIGGAIPEPRKIGHVDPVYPDIAKQARVQGIVILECTIDTQGRVSDVRVLRGIPLLDEAAIEAVRQWVYEPTRLNGVPVPVLMTVTVNFRLN